MKLLSCLAFIGLIGVVFGGGTSTCGQITTDFVQLLQICELKIQRFLKYLTFDVIHYPGITTSSITFFHCDLNATTHILATGLSRISGVDRNYILDILTGSISTPFASPIDCIENEIQSYPEYIKNVTTNVILKVEALGQVSPINESTNCSFFIEYSNYYYEALTGLLSIENDMFTIDLAEFSSIGYRDLYLENIDTILTCRSTSFLNSLSDLTNANQSLFNDYFTNQTQSLPPPYDCVQGMIDDSWNQIIDKTSQLKEIIANKSTDSCQPLLGQVVALQNIWTDYMTNLSNYAIGKAIQNPVLAPAFSTVLYCEVRIMLDFAANAISSMSNVDPDYISSILNGSASAPFEPPLDCVTNNLISMKNKIASLLTTFVPQVKLLAVPSLVNTSTCSAAYSGLTSYVHLMPTLIGSKGPYVNNGLEAFTSIGFDDLYLNSMAMLLECVPRILGSYGGAALNTDGSALTAYVSGKTKTLPYPFNCVKVLINFLSSIVNQAIVSYSTNEPVNLRVPSIPPYRG